MSKYVNFSIDEDTLKKLNEMKDLLETNKSKLFRDMVKFFYKNRALIKTIRPEFLNLEELGIEILVSSHKEA